MNNAPHLKILLCLNGDKDSNKPLLDRAGVLLRYALEAKGIEYTYDMSERYDIAHLLSLTQYRALMSFRQHRKSNPAAPTVITLFNDVNDIKAEIKADDDDSQTNYQNALQKSFRQLKADKIICDWPSQALILKHLNIFATGIEAVPIGAKEYRRENYLPVELSAFRKYYGLKPDDKVIVSYGEYSYDKGLSDLEAIARILPEYEFFFFGGKAGIISKHRHFERVNSIPNLHYEGHLPEELYHSALFTAYAAFIPYKYHIDSVFLLELMKAGVPIVANHDPFLYDLLIDRRTALLGHDTETFYHALKNIGNENAAETAKTFAARYTPEEYGQKLVSLYTELINLGSHHI